MGCHKIKNMMFSIHVVIFMTWVVIYFFYYWCLDIAFFSCKAETLATNIIIVLFFLIHFPKLCTILFLFVCYQRHAIQFWDFGLWVSSQVRVAGSGTWPTWFGVQGRRVLEGWQFCERCLRPRARGLAILWET